jgi:hypothetical protein
VQSPEFKLQYSKKKEKEKKILPYMEVKGLLLPSCEKAHCYWIKMDGDKKLLMQTASAPLQSLPVPLATLFLYFPVLDPILGSRYQTDTSTPCS